MTRRRGGHRPTLQPNRTTPGAPPAGPAGASSANAPAGPAIVYISGSGERTLIDERAPAGLRDRALCRALLGRAQQLLTDAETETAKHPVGFTAGGG